MSSSSGRRQSQWLINTAMIEAEPATKVKRGAAAGQDPLAERLHGLFLWSGHESGHDCDERSFMTRQVMSSMNTKVK